ncbi:MAG: peptidoglycan DD-metalloendopeptidase family protein [Candidatus Obscuribacterales bacterium]|nr:peptidoglycan DD-metalloendopeptidase family protein [Steroidobacteraceae bacterium]
MAHWRWLFIGFAVPLAGGIAMFSWFPQSNDVAFGPAINLTEQIVTVTSPDIELPPPILEPLGDDIEFVVRRNDTLERIFRQLRLNLEDLATIRNLPGIRDNLDTLKPGELITFVHSDGAILSLIRRITETATLSVRRDDLGFAAQIIETPLDVRLQHVHGTIESSLFAAARAAGISSDVIMRLANDIFGWDIDFALEIQPNDTFTIAYEKKYRGDEYIGDGRILAAEFVNNNRVYRAIRFESADGQLADYFTPEGRSMRKQFLRAPLDFTHISSNFNPRRLHPILNRIRAHQGVDYAAPTNTPIKAAGDGRVEFIGVKGGYGKVVILEHGGAITSLYGHMIRYAKDLRAGTRVKQGQIIGFVGSTGSATGPHLHYEYRLGGVYKNPRTVNLPDAKPIPPGYKVEFESQGGTLLSQLDKAKAARIAALP